MIYNILAGTGIGILTGHTAAVCGGTIPLVILFTGIILGFLSIVRSENHPNLRFASVFAAIALRLVLFHPLLCITELQMLFCGIISGMGFALYGKEKSSVLALCLTGAVSFISFLLFFSGTGEAAFVYIAGTISLLLFFFKDKKYSKFAAIAALLALYSLFPAGSISNQERARSIMLSERLRAGAVNAMCLVPGGVATKALIVSNTPQLITSVIKDIPGFEKCDVITHYFGLYPILNRRGEKSYPVVFSPGSGRMCRLASRLVANNGILVVHEENVAEVPAAFRYWSRLSSAPEFIVLSRTSPINTSAADIERKMQKHLAGICRKGEIPEGVLSAICDFPESDEHGIREQDNSKRINYTLWFFGLISGTYLILRLLVFSRFDKGERRWTALENTASTVLLFMLLKRSPDNIFTAVLPAALFFSLPVLKVTGKKWRALQIINAALIVTSAFIPKFLNASQLTAAVCCGVMWYNLRKENGAVREWVDGCSLLGFTFGAAIYTMSLTLNAPTVFIIGIALLLRSNALFRSFQ